MTDEPPAKKLPWRPRSVDMTDPEVAEQVRLFGTLWATHPEMAHWFGCSKRTVEREMSNEEGEFYRTYSQAASDTKVSLRRQQLAKAMEGDNTMMIWLGKQGLGQKDKIEHGGDKDAPIELKHSGTITLAPEEAYRVMLDGKPPA